ncbi:MAG: UDP-N-acetylglucosamine--N-acetylmuramyl-(pentapeptide) pyrophosphoryl-undecaprenol, partial [bacterium]
MALKVIIAGGGTGGHIFPGVAIAREFKRRDSENEVIFVGTENGLEKKIIPHEGFKLEMIHVAALKSVSMTKRIKSLLMLPGSFLEVRRLLKSFRPDVVIGVGGYSSGPVLLLSAFQGLPTMVVEPNALPGFTNRVLASFIDKA